VRRDGRCTSGPYDLILRKGEGALSWKRRGGERPGSANTRERKLRRKCGVSPPNPPKDAALDNEPKLRGLRGAHEI